MARRAAENEPPPPGPHATVLAALWLYACVLTGIFTTLEYLNVPVRAWLAHALAVLRHP
jgi:hypothetical protein